MIVIASSLNSTQNEILTKHRADVDVVQLAGNPWDVPTDAVALFTYQTQWKDSPATKPQGWPFNLKWIQVASAGVDTLPAWVYEVPLVTRGRGVQAPMIAEYVIGAVYAHEKRFWDGAVRTASDWKPKMLGSVAGKSIGIAGFGAIGAEVASLALPLGMQVYAMTRSSKVAMDGVQTVSDLDALMAVSDHLVIAMPYTPETHRIFNAARFASARPGLHLINVARGTLVDDDALLVALDTGRLSAATLDVTTPEPLPEGHSFYTHPAIRLTPHISGGSEDGEERLARRLTQNLDDYLEGKPVAGVVEGSRGY